MAMNAAFDTSPKVLHIQRVIGKETRVFFRPRGDSGHDPLVVESWRTPGAFQAVIVTNDLWRKARTARSSLEIETRKGWLGYEYLTRDPVLVSAPKGNANRCPHPIGTACWVALDSLVSTK
jgi:hypothetical protein